MQNENNAREDSASLGRFCSWNGRRSGVGEITNEKNKLPTLLFGELPFVGRHGLVALRDDVEDFTVSDFLEAGGFGEVEGARVIHFCLRAISLPSFAMAFRALIEEDGQDLFCSGGGVERERVFRLFRLDRDGPGTTHECGIGKIGGESEKNDEQNGGGTSRRSLWGIGHQLNFPTKSPRAAPADVGLRSESEPKEFSVEEEDSGGDDPGDDERRARVCKFAHAAAVAGELDKRNDGERKLKAENHLAKDEEHAEFGFAKDANDEDRGENGDTARNKATQPGLEADLEKAFHDDLACECARKRGVLAGGKQSAGKESAGEACPESWGKELVGF